jgi:activator of HSP90 ATPase
MCGALGLLGSVFAAGQQEHLTSLHQEVTFKASPAQVYNALLNSKRFASFSGFPAQISSKEGGSFVMFGNRIFGRNIELIPNSRIVQAWRPTSWNPGVYSVVKFELKKTGSETTVILDHTGFPEGDAESLGGGWRDHYWEPLKKYFEKY